MKKPLICMLLILAAVLLSADLREEAIALKSWLAAPFDSSQLEAERDQKLAQLQNPVKGEFETSAQFEQRKQDSGNQIKAIQAQYAQKIQDARAAHETRNAALRANLQALLAQSRETVVLKGSLGSYDADSQKYRVSIPERAFDIVVPLAKGPELKKNFGKYELRVTRQLDENLQWSYLEAQLAGSGGTFSSTDKAPALAGLSPSGAIVPPVLAAVVTFNEPGGNDMLDAEETARVGITIKNSGKGSAWMVEARFDLGTAIGISYPNSVYFGEIKPGEQISKELQLIAGMELRDAQAALNIRFSEQNGFPPDDKVLSFTTRALQPPDLYIADTGIDDFSKNGRIEPAEPVEIRARIHNRGRGTARNVIAQVVTGEGVYLYGESNQRTYNLGNMEPGEYRDVVFDIITAKTARELDLSLDLRESRSQFSKPDLPLNLAFNRVERTADQMVVQGRESDQMIGTAPALSVDVDLDIPERGKPQKNRWGVIIGIENYRNVQQVEFARRDAEFMREYFNKALGIPSENIYVKTDDGATLGEFQALFNPRGWLEKNANKKDSEIFIYYSGHGAPDAGGSEAFLLPHDGNPNFASNTGYPLQQLYTNLGSLKARQVTIFLDSCFSGGTRGNEIILAGAKPVFISPELPSVAANVTVFSAASGSQIASSYPDMQHGLFSYYLMKGMRGEADANSDRKITQSEMNSYLGDNVGSMARRMGREQDPQLQSGEPDRGLLQW
ncbi:MAG: caspase family protein [Candidatus Cloacimonetes bacterium]|nr:caspase family protein [Candidatus Cloacimonadota bacterium]